MIASRVIRDQRSCDEGAGCRVLPHFRAVHPSLSDDWYTVGTLTDLDRLQSSPVTTRLEVHVRRIYLVLICARNILGCSETNYPRARPEEAVTQHALFARVLANSA